MATPGWYPDPAGQPNTFRYWDGQAWSEETSPSPYVAPPGSETPPPPPPGPPTGPPPSEPPGHGSPQRPPERPAQPLTQFPGGPPAQPGPGGYSGYGGGSGWTPMSAPAVSGGSGAGRKVLIVALVVLLLVGVGLAGFFGVRALTGDDGDSRGSDEPSQATDSEEDADPTDDAIGGGADRPEALLETCGAGAPDGGAPVDKRMRGGGLVMPTPSGYTAEGWDGIKAAFTFADQVALAVQEIQQDKWISNYTVGGLPTSPGYDGLDQAAESVMECMANSTNFFQNFESRKDLAAEEVEVDGHDAYRLVSEIRVDDPELTVDGDQVSVVVVDTGEDGTYGLYVSVVPIGDDELIDQEETVFDELQVGGGRADTA